MSSTVAQADEPLQLSTRTRGSSGCECSYSRTPALEPAQVLPTELLPQHPLYSLEQGKKNF